MLTSPKSAVAAAAVVFTCLAFTGGCSSSDRDYYRVRDPNSGRVFYTKDLDQRSAGAVTLVDGASGQKVTLQNSEIKGISKQTYYSSRLTSGKNPEVEAKAAEARAAEAKAAQEKAAAESRDAEAKLASAKTDAAASQSPQQFRDNLASAKDEIDRTLAALSDVTNPNQADLSSASKRFVAQVDALDAHAQTVKADADAMRQSREVYFAKWDTRIAAIDNPTLRTEAEAKRTRLRASQEKIQMDANAVKEAYRPFMADLHDTRKLLASDASKDSVSILTSMEKKVQENGQLVKQRIDTVIADLDAVEGKAAAAPAAVAPASIAPAAAPQAAPAVQPVDAPAAPADAPAIPAADPAAAPPAAPKAVPSPQPADPKIVPKE